MENNNLVENDTLNESTELILKAIKESDQDMKIIFSILKRANKQLEQEVLSE